jgi:hypothetical protein
MTLAIRKRWTFYPALLAVSLLGKLGIIKDVGPASKWIAKHCLVGLVLDGEGRVKSLDRL